MAGWTRGLLLVGAGLSVSMAAYHFVLPIHFRWADHVETIPPVIRWALFAINFFFSLLLAVSGVTVFAVAWNRAHAHGPGLWVVAGGATFWAANLGFQVIRPFTV